MDSMGELNGSPDDRTCVTGVHVSLRIEIEFWLPALIRLNSEV